MKRKKLQSSITAALCAGVILLLFAPVFFRFFSLTVFFETLFSDSTVSIIKTSVFQAGLSSLLCFIISLAPAYFITRSDSFIARLLDSTFFIPFFFPVVSTVIGFSVIFRALHFDIQYSLSAVLAAHVFYNTPVFIRYISQAWKGIDSSLHDHTVIETSSWYSVFFHVVLPHILKSAARAFFIVFTFCFTSFGIILAMGKISLTNFEIAIYSRLHTSLDISAALSLALIQFLILGLLNFIITKTESHEISHDRVQKTGVGKTVTFFSLLFLVFEGAVVFSSFAASIVYSISKGKNYFQKIFSTEFNREFPVIEALLNSFFLSLITGVLVTALSYILLKNKSRLIEFFVTSLYSVSMAMLSIALIIITVTTSALPPLMLSAGFILVTLPISYSFMQQHVQSFDISLLQQSYTDGANVLKTFRHIELPLMIPVFITNFLQVSAIVFGEFTVSYMFQSGSNFPLISVVNYSVNARRLLGESYAINTVSACIIAGVFILSTLIPHYRESK